VGVLYWTILEKTRFGYAVRAIGGNRLAAVENGINAVRVEKWLYVGAGAVAALAGVIYTARTGAGQVSAGGAAVTLTVISAVLIGGTSLFGGLGKITGTALGAILFAEIDNALALSGVAAQYGSVIIGSILILAVAADSYRRKRVFRARR
jgi:ribose transport system permease protein